MGMTIEEAIDFLEESKYSPYETPSSYTIDMAIDTMRKYQKIVQIINYRYTKSVSETLDEIVKVVENGKNNR